MRVRNSTEARRQAHANADRFDRPYAYGTDTSGNWRVERLGDRPPGEEWSGVPGWTVVHPGGLETRGGYGTRPASRNLRLLHWQRAEHGQWTARTIADPAGAQPYPGRNWFVISRVGAGPVPGGRRPAFRLKYRGASGDSILADRDFETLKDAQRFAETWQVPFNGTNDGYGYGFDDGDNPPRGSTSPSMRRRYKFFQQYGGMIVGETAKTALALARSEEEASSRGWIVSWEPEEDIDDSWMTPEERRQPHEVYAAILRDEGGNVLASLGNIFDPDSNYMRIVSAELAAEALEERE